MLALSMILVACGPKETTEAPATEATEGEKTEAAETTEKPADETTEETEEPTTTATAGVTDDTTIDGYALPYPQAVEQDGDAIEGGTLNVALIADSPFTGIFHTSLYSANPDYELMRPMLGAFMQSGPDVEIVDGEMSQVSFDAEAKTATIKIADELTWSDGVPVTADDLEWQYLLIAHPDYTGVRYDDDYRNVVGIEEYNAGEAETISGLSKPDDKTLVIQFKEFTPSISWGAGLPYNPEPAHVQKDIPVAELETSDVVRKTPLACGPFMMSNIVEGESVEYVPNPHWPFEKPKVERIVMTRTPSDTIVQAIKSGTFDIIDGVSVDAYEEYKDLSNIQLLSTMSRAYGYIGFKLGKWNADTEEVEMDPNAKMADVELRKAMAHAMNNDEIAEVFYNSLRYTANTLITPFHYNFHDETIPPYEFNPDKAMEILDAAGYADVDGDGFREDKNGEPLVINFASMAGGEIAEPLATAYIQYWQDIGLNVQLTGGRLLEFNAFYEQVQNDDPEIDIFMGAWNTGSNPDPVGLYGRKAEFNFSRFASDVNDAALAKIASSDALEAMLAGDKTVLYGAYSDWQKEMQEEVPVIPTHYRLQLSIINNRVKAYDISLVTDFSWENIELLSDTPEVAQ